MDIWIEQLAQCHMPILEHWLGRTAGRMTICDIPKETELLSQWYDRIKTVPRRLDCLALAYETPIGITGFQRTDSNPDEAELYLMLGETNYNLIRTATYSTLRILDRAFQDYCYVSAAVYDRHEEYLSSLWKMGFSQTDSKNGLITVNVKKEVFVSRKYLF